MSNSQTNKTPIKIPGQSNSFWSSISLAISFIFSLLSISVMLYYFLNWRLSKSIRQPFKNPLRKPGDESLTAIILGIKTPSSRKNNQLAVSSVVKIVDKPELPINPANPITTTSPKTFTETQQKQARIKYSSLRGLIVLIFCISLLTFTQLIINLSDWFKIDLSFLTPLEKLNCVIPSLCNLRFPPYGFIALFAALLAAVVFGLQIIKMGLPILATDLKIGAITNPQIKRLAYWPTNLIGLVFLICQGVVITQAILGQSVQPIIWLAGLVSALMLAWQATRPIETTGGDNPLWDLAYLTGIFTLLLTSASITTQHWALSIMTGIITTLFLGGSFYIHRQSWNSIEKTVRLAIPALTFTCFKMLSYGINSWGWSFLGDEYSFFDLAREFAQGKVNVFASLLSGAGVYGYHPILSSAWQGLTMWLFGIDAYGWRISHSLLLAISVPLFYYFMRSVVGRGGALIAAALYGSAHIVLSLGRVGSNNAQIIIIMALSWAAFLWSARRGNLTGFALTGIFIGLGFYTYAVARIYSLLIAVWLMLYYFPIHWRQRRINWSHTAVWICVVGFAVLTALPVLSTRTAWEGQLQQTIFTSEVAFTPYDIFIQFLKNTFYSFSSFLYNNQNAVFVYGAHADPITGSLMFLGLSAIIATWKHGWRLRIGLLATYVIYTVIVGGMQPYDYPSITRMFTMAPFYAIFGSIGLVAVYKILAQQLPTNPVVQAIPGFITVILVGSIMLLNNWISLTLSQRHVGQQLPAFLLQTAQLTGDAQGNGPPIYFVAQPNDEFWIKKLYEVYDIPPDRYTLIYPRDALQNEQVCEAGQHAAILMIPTTVTDSGYIADQIHNCWANSQIRLIKNGQANGVIYRVMNAQALAAVHAIPGYWTEEKPPKAELMTAPTNTLWQAFQPRGLGIDANGKIAVVEASTSSILFFNSTGKIDGMLKGLFIYPSDAAFLPNGDLVVADAGIGVLIFDTKGNLRTQIGSSSARGLYTTSQSDIYVAEAGSGHISVYNTQGELMRTYTAEGHAGQPTSVAISETGLIAIGDPILGKVFIVDREDHIQHEFAISPGDSSDRKPGLLWLPDDSLLYTDASGGLMWQVRPDGSVMHKWTDLQQPNDLALGSDGIVYLLESGANRVVPMTIH